jgi:hypothetical protein
MDSLAINKMDSLAINKMDSLTINDKTQLTLVSPAIPPEVILRIVEKLPFNDGKIIASLRQVHPRLNAVLGNYERSITRNFMTKELPHASTDFPCCEKFGFKCLADCVKRYDIVDDVMDALVSKQNCAAVEPFNMALVHAGVLLLYCLRFMGESISPSHGPTRYIHPTYPPNQANPFTNTSQNPTPPAWLSSNHCPATP